MPAEPIPTFRRRSDDYMIRRLAALVDLADSHPDWTRDRVAAEFRRQGWTIPNATLNHILRYGTRVWYAALPARLSAIRTEQERRRREAA